MTLFFAGSVFLSLTQQYLMIVKSYPLIEPIGFGLFTVAGLLSLFILLFDILQTAVERPSRRYWAGRLEKRIQTLRQVCEERERFDPPALSSAIGVVVRDMEELAGLLDPNRVKERERKMMEESLAGPLTVPSSTKR